MSQALPLSYNALTSARLRTFPLIQTIVSMTKHKIHPPKSDVIGDHRPPNGQNLVCIKLYRKKIEQFLFALFSGCFFGVSTGMSKYDR